LWTPPSEAELLKGGKAIAIAQSISAKPERETAYINAMAAFYNNWEKIDHHTRCINYEKAMEKMHAAYPTDKEAAIFYALALDAAADPADKTFARQRKAGALLNALYPSGPNHPGIIHYLIHTYDYPGLADSALGAARRYAQVAPSSAHALHMPSHIFTRLGLWDECIQSNLASVAAAKCYAEQAGIKGHWDEELHGLDYLVYAYLQKGDNKNAREQFIYLQSITHVQPANFKVAYAFAAIPARIYLENKSWKEAATAQHSPADFPWSKFPWQSAIIHFTRLMGAAHLGKDDLAAAELNILQQLHDTLALQKDTYKTNQVAVQIKTGAAWIQYLLGQKQTALNQMTIAANMEDATEKHPVTPAEVLPARELLADMLFDMGQYQNALAAYEAVLQKSPGRFNAVYGAGSAAYKLGNRQKAVLYYGQLLAMAKATNADRTEIAAARRFLKVP
jgi:tetratricopeptide (TPR) repeat protein